MVGCAPGDRQIYEAMMRIAVILIGFLVLSGCGLYAQQKQREVTAQAQQTLSDAVDECRRANLEEIKQAISRAICINQSMELIRSLVPFPDLLDQENAARLGIAEKIQNGKITPIEAKVQFASLHSQLVSEEQRRGLAGRSVGAQEASAAAAWRAATPDVPIVFANPGTGRRF
jgi:hypothetical protein